MYESDEEYIRRVDPSPYQSYPRIIPMTPSDDPYRRPWRQPYVEPWVIPGPRRRPDADDYQSSRRITKPSDLPQRKQEMVTTVNRGDDFLISVLAYGVKKEDISVETFKQTVKVRLKADRTCGFTLSINEEIEVPLEFSTERAKSNLKDGILNIICPLNIDGPKPRRVTVE